MRFTTISPEAAAEVTADVSAPASPLDMLLACHAHIRHFMQLSRTLAGAEGMPHQEIADTAVAISRYFVQALPLHEADENDTLFSHIHPVLPEGGLVREAVETMVEQHHAINELLPELLSICATLVHHPEGLPSVALRLGHVTSALDQIFTVHLRMEETVIFPALLEWTTPAQREEMSREMKLRRQAPADNIHLVSKSY